MARFFKKRTLSRGEVPGSFIFIGKQKIEKPRIRIIDYTDENLEEIEIKDFNEIKKYVNSKSVTWLNIDGLHDIELIKQVEELFEIHPLHLEDILNTDHRPVLIEGDNYILFILKMLRFEEEEKKIHSEQFSMMLKNNFVITFQERVGDVFEPVRERIRKKKGRIRTSGTDYLAYSLFDTIVDNYIYLIEGIGERIEELENMIYKSPSQSVAKEIFNHKMELNFFRKSIRPVREILNQLYKSETGLVNKKNIQFFNDLNQLVLQAIEAIETYNYIITDQLNIYNTVISNRMNEIMKVLTVFAAIFIPLTFFAGIYGMNFEYMPELKFKYGYLFFWIWIVIVAIIMLIYFRKKRWINK